MFRAFPFKAQSEVETDSVFLSNQKVLCDDRFMGGVAVETEVLEKQMLSQMLEAIRVTPSLHEDLQVEVMKVNLLNSY